MLSMQDLLIVPVWCRAARARMSSLELVDEAGNQMLIHQTMASDHLKGVDHSGVITGESME